MRIFLTHHVTWSGNSVCHTFGSRPFQTKDRGRNQWMVGLLALGEGWHNNHHAFPRSALHGLRWWRFDLSGLTIRLLERPRLAWDVQRVNAAGSAPAPPNIGRQGGVSADNRPAIEGTRVHRNQLAVSS